MPAANLKDSKGQYHYVISQKEMTTCGPASMAMVEAYYKMKCMNDPEDRLKELSAKLPDGWKPGQGTQFTSLATTLNLIGVKSKMVTVLPAQVFDTLRASVAPRTPAIVEVQHLGRAGFFHAVVCRTIYPDDLAVFLDPATDPPDGIVEVKKRNSPTFQFDPFGKWIFTGDMITCSL
jgi:hypothetical protein